MDDGSREYKGFVVDQENRLSIQGVYPKETYGGRIKFADIIGKFNPDDFFLLEPIEVDKLDYNELRELYRKSKLPYHGGFRIIKESSENVEIVWDCNARKEVLTKEDCKNLKLYFKRSSKGHYTK